MSCCSDNNSPVWFGNCSKVYKNITDNNGHFQSHIQSQTYAISDIINSIKDNNIQLLNLNDLSKFIKMNVIKNKKDKTDYNIDISNLNMCHLKKNYILFSKKNLKTNQTEIILKMYNEDLIFINKLSSKYKWINIDEK